MLGLGLDFCQRMAAIQSRQAKNAFGIEQNKRECYCYTEIVLFNTEIQSQVQTKTR